MRRLITGLLVLASALTLVLASVSLWTRQNVVDTEAFVSTVETIVDLPEVESRITERVTETVMTQPAVEDAVDEAVAVLPERLQQFEPTVESGVRSVVAAGVQRLLTNDPFRPLTTAALTSAHGQLVAGEPVEYTLGQAKGLVPDAAQDGVAGQVLDLLPDDVGVTLLTPAGSPEVYSAIDLLESVWWWLGLIALGALAGALGISRRRRGTLRAWAVTATVLVLLVLAALRVARGLLLPRVREENRDAVGAVYDVLAGSLRSWTLWLLAAVLLVLVLTLVWGRLGLVAGVRRGLASARAQVRRRQEARAQAAAGAAPGQAVAPGEAAAPAAGEPWARRVAAWWRGFAEGLELPERSARLGASVRAHLGPARWAGITVGAVVLLFWPEPTLSVLVWVAALVALYLGALEWLQNRAAEPAADGQRPAAAGAPAGTPGPAAPEPSAGPPAAVPAPRWTAGPAPDGGAPGGAPVATLVDTAPAPEPLLPAALTPETLSTLSGRLDLLVRLGEARDAGVLSEEEFSREKARLLGG
ncbi:SHOCT domain-containing protein [Geodermatophilus marinus]|uniref:SHOCT domain-containing protein n=1 Tax=Geodermatophilus sp. LHW52908 TaxID=2303986 RepID=UPI000E3CB161|nr:SHOCT domain-containing protein [Geodermatophilus sp. LHW52908]RFU19678.1 SHOCT domain-containing protein [Geodermatophilus sp. LHW52908]